MPLTFNAIFLGNVATVLDPTEGNNNAENAGSTAFVGQTFGSISAPLTARWVSLTSVNLGGAANVLDQNNNLSNDQVTVTTASGSVTRVFDAGSNYLGRITYVDGTQSVAGLSLSIIQTTNGDVFLVPALSGATNTALTFKAIRSITLNSLQTSNFSGMQSDRPVLNFITCFAGGTEIATPAGPRRIETLRAGDSVTTLDHGPRVLRWTGCRHLSRAELEANPNLAPIRIRAGALGCGLPQRDLIVSPQHRVLVNSAIAGRMTGAGAVLVAARHLVGLPGIAPWLPEDGIDYWHILFDGHEVVLSEGAPTESLWPGQEAMKAMSPEDRAAITASLCPDAAGGAAMPAPARQMVPARPFVTGKLARRMTERHARNAKTVLASPPMAGLLSGKVKRMVALV